jgi:hypothetical protein
MSATPRHLAYVLRLWVVGQGETRQWRASLEDIHSPARSMFADMDGLIRYLNTLTASSEQAGGDEDGLLPPGAR